MKFGGFADHIVGFVQLHWILQAEVHPLLLPILSCRIVSGFLRICTHDCRAPGHGRVLRVGTHAQSIVFLSSLIVVPNVLITQNTGNVGVVDGIASVISVQSAAHLRVATRVSGVYALVVDVGYVLVFGGEAAENVSADSAMAVAVLRARVLVSNHDGECRRFSFFACSCHLIKVIRSFLLLLVDAGLSVLGVDSSLNRKELLF